MALLTTTTSPDVIIRDGEASQCTATTTPPTTTNHIKLLVADDDTVTRRLLVQSASRWGYDVAEAQDGPSALRALTAGDAPQLAILDWEMPGLSGIELCRILRARRRTPYVYILLLTGREGREHVITGLTAGADDYIRKPFDAHELEVRLRAGSRIVELQQRLLETQRALERRARFDFLTDAHNRETIWEAVHDELARSRRTKHPFSVVLFDIDHFKSVNDTYGHAVGDDVLKEAVRRAKETVRPYDVVGRWGGEEFLILAPGCSVPQGALVGERMKVALSSTPFETAAGPIRVTASFGVASTKQGYSDVDKLVEAADKALYLAKHSGRNRVEIADNAEGNGDNERQAVTLNAPTNESSMLPPAHSCAPRAAEPERHVERPETATSPKLVSARPSMRWSTVPVFDPEVFGQLKDLVEGTDVTFLNDLFENYLDTAEKSLASLRTVDDLELAKRAAHTLKGSSLNVGATAVAMACKEFEERAAKNQEAVAVKKWVNLIEDQVDRVREGYAVALRRLLSSPPQA